MALNSSMSPGQQASQSLSLNMKLVSHHEMGGFGGVGEGMGMQKTKDGRRVMWLGHEGAPKNFTAIDVTDPKNPKQIIQTELPHNEMRSNNLEVLGDTMFVSHQIRGKRGMKPAGFDIWDISKPEEPKKITHFDASGPHSLGVHCLWCVDGEYLHMSSGAPDFQPRNPNDHQFYRIIDVRNLSKPVEVGRWWYPGQKEGDAAPALPRHPKFDGGYRPHNIQVYPQRPDRAYVAYIDGGVVILDISDKAHPKEISRYNYSPPYNGFTHTALPLFSRGLMIVSDECTKDDGIDWPKLAWVFDIREERNPVPIATLPLPSAEVFTKRGGRFGAHNLYENYPGDVSWRSDSIVLGTFFNGGVRVYDLANPYQPKEVAYFVPGAPKLSPKGSVQINDVYVDDRQLVYIGDRFTGGLYVLEMNI
ncbi:MAG: LVIVD repeat-containing protein [Betaproteobacteria bacterium]